MSDGRLRELERRAERSGSLEDALELLVARRRAGLSEGQLALAAYLGDPAALELSGSRRGELLGNATVGEAIGWAAPLAGWGAEVGRRCGLALARQLLPEWERHSERLKPRWRNPGSRGRPRLDPRPGQLLGVLEAWCREPSAARGASLERAWAECEEVTFLRAESWRARAALTAVRTLLCAAQADPVGAVRVGYDALHPDAGARLLAALEQEVLPWALGGADPLRPAR